VSLATVLSRLIYGCTALQVGLEHAPFTADPTPLRAPTPCGITMDNMVRPDSSHMITPPWLTILHQGLIRFKIVTHAFADGKSRFVTGIRASNNNRAETVLELFIEAVDKHGLPSRLRGDHGTENVLVAQFMEDVRGVLRGSYIWGRYAATHAATALSLTASQECPQYAHRASLVRRHSRIRLQVEAVFHGP
jgi:hypothetical protein